MNAQMVMVGVPTRGYINFNTAQRLLQLQAAHPAATYHLEPGALCVSDTRNKLVKRFLQETTCEVLLMVDDDVVPRMTVLAMADHPYDIVGATYHVIRHELTLPFPAVFKWTGTAYWPIDKVFGRTGLVPCDAVATGCMAIKRHVLEHPEMRAPFLIEYDEWGAIKLSDDVKFCDRARRLGFTIMADYDQHADHCPTSVSLNRISAQYQTAYTRARTIERKESALVTLA